MKITDISVGTTKVELDLYFQALPGSAFKWSVTTLLHVRRRDIRASPRVLGLPCVQGIVKEQCLLTLACKGILERPLTRSMVRMAPQGLAGIVARALSRTSYQHLASKTRILWIYSASLTSDRSGACGNLSFMTGVDRLQRDQWRGRLRGNMLSGSSALRDAIL